MSELLLSSGASPGLVTAIAWLLTYLVHSTLLLGGAWLASRWLRGRLEPIGEILWKCALVGGVLTASLQTVADLHPYGGKWELATASASARAFVAPPVTPPAVVDAQAVPRETTPLRSTSWESAPTVRGASQPVAGVRPATSSSPDIHSLGSGSTTDSGPGSSARPPLSTLLAGFLLAVSAAGLMRLAWAQFRLGRGRRSPICSGPLFRRLVLLRRVAQVRQRVRLTRSVKFPVPMALGVFRLEICVPPRALSDLTVAQQDSMLAHELAHLLRRDPLWLALAGAIERLFWFQPLNRLARYRLQESAEFACDAWAAEQTGGHLPLARCLTEVAGWTVGRSAPAEFASAVLMARSPSTLGRRITRLLHPVGSLPSRTLAPWRWLAPLVLLAGATAMAPGVAAVIPPQESDPEAEPTAVAGLRSTPVADDLAPPRALPLPDAFIALDEEMTRLHAEVALLQGDLSNTPAAASVAATAEHLLRQADELQARAADLRALGMIPTPAPEPQPR